MNEIRQAMSLAYGFLWRVQGDASKDINIQLAYAARLALRSILTKDEQRAGIDLAREDISFEVSWPKPAEQQGEMP